ncbi:MAG: hypothetical protein ABH854_00680 [Candidatus Diapherotrites archaeon]
MANEALEQIIGLAEPYLNLIFPNFMSALFPLVMLMSSIAVYAVLIYHFYRMVAKRDVFELDMEKYKRTKEGYITKIFNTILGVFKYGLLFPGVVFMWFAGFSILLSLLAKNIDATQILLISATFVASIRLTSYYTEDLSRDVAKMIPFALLGIAIVDPTFFSLDLFMARLASIPQFIPQVAAYLLFMILLEWVLRVLLFLKHSILGVAGSGDAGGESAQE